MRIIAGTYRGRPLVGPPSDQVTRPITDRAKQALFDALGTLDELPWVLDCFSGPGSMGLECLSRGSKFALFVERDRHAQRALKTNITALQLTAQTHVLTCDAYGAGLQTALRNKRAELGPLGLAFLDPPYKHMETGHERRRMDELTHFMAQEIMRPDGLIIIRHPTRVMVDATVTCTQIFREMKFSEMAITWLIPAENRQHEPVAL